MKINTPPKFSVDPIADDTGWSPYLTPEDDQKLDTVRLALRRGDISEASKYGRVLELVPRAPADEPSA